VSAAGAPAPAEAVQRIAASAWSFRWQVELEAEQRFARLAGRLEQVGAARPLVELARRASEDERRHAGLCAGLAAENGQPVPAAAPPPPPEIAPPGLALRERVLYEVVAACCVAETVSMGVLTALLGSARTPRLRQVLRELAADEVGHARLGWAHLAAEREASSFLGPLVPGMLQGSVEEDLFATVPAEREDQGLLEVGVLPHALQRRVFTGVLEEVVFPGLESSGVDPAPARAWLEARRAGHPRR
jgi:hypothetical protein